MNVRAKYRIRRWSSLLLAIVFTLMSLGLAGAQSDVYLPIVSNANRNQTIPPASSQSISVTVVEESRSAVVAAPPKHTLETTSAVPQTTAVTNSNAPTWDKFGNFSVTGNIGAGIENPAERIHINGGPARFRINDTRASPSGDPAFTFFIRGAQKGAMFFQDSQGDQMVLRAGTGSNTNDIVIQQPSTAGSNTRLFIRADGRVGIGTTAPGHPLDVVGDIQTQGPDAGFRFRSRGGAGGREYLWYSEDGQARLWSGTDVLVVKAVPDVRVGIGIPAPDEALDVLGAILTQGSDAGFRFKSQGGAGGREFEWYSEAGKARLQSGTRDLLTINGDLSGHVGIGTNFPDEKLHVIGKIKANNVVAHSDARLKTDVERIEGALEMVANMEGVHYQFDLDTHAERNLPEGEQIGFIAQDLEEILPEVVFTASDGYKSVDYSKVTPVLVNAIQEQQAEITQLRGELAELKAVVDTLLAQQQADD